MKPNRLADYLEHILEAANRACDFVVGMEKKEFLEDERTQYAVSFNIVIIGEFIAKIMRQHEDFVDSHPDIYWHKFRDVGNRLTHEYFEVNQNTVWDITQIFVPQLILQVTQILEETGK